MILFDADGAVVVFNNAADNCETQPSATLFGREVGKEEALLGFLRYPWAAVSYTNFYGVATHNKSSGDFDFLYQRVVYRFRGIVHQIGDGALNGVTVGDLDRQARQQFDLPAGIHGVVVTDVDPNSAAAEAGLKPGDVIQEINRKPVKNAEDAVKMTEKTTDKTTLLKVWRDGGSRYVVVDESKNAG